MRVHLSNGRLIAHRFFRKILPQSSRSRHLQRSAFASRRFIFLALAISRASGNLLFEIESLELPWNFGAWDFEFCARTAIHWSFFWSGLECCCEFPSDQSGTSDCQSGRRLAVVSSDFALRLAACTVRYAKNYSNVVVRSAGGRGGKFLRLSI